MYVNTFLWMYGNFILGDSMELKRIKNLREDSDKLQKDIAEYLKITQQQYSLYERGIRDLPIDLLIKLSDLYKVSTDYILNRTNKKEINK
jgi:transcriptional regulator with XRE-family HTH domain